MLRVIFVIALATVCLTHDANKTNWERLVCDPNGQFQPPHDLDVELKKCGNENCVFQCQAKIMGWHNSDGTNSLDIFEDYVTIIAPLEYRKIALDRARECYDTFGKYMDKDDESCRMSKEFADCCWSLLPLMKCTPDNTGSPPKETA